MGCIPLDVQTEILSHLPVQSLLRFRATNKFYRHTIDSTTFQEMQYVLNRNEEDDTILLQFNSVLGEVSMLSPDRKGFITCMEVIADGLELDDYDSNYLKVVGPVDGLICIHNVWSMGPMAICNPSLGQIKILPMSPIGSFCGCRELTNRNVGIGIGLDNTLQDYKLVQLLSCFRHRRLHASVYSKGTNSWRELLGDNILDRRLYIIEPIKSSCKKGSFAHWRAIRGVGRLVKSFILSFDMENDVFRTFHMPEYESLATMGEVNIFGKDDGSFILFIYNDDDTPCNWLKIYEARFEGNTLHWDFLTEVVSLDQVIPRPKALWGTNYMGLDNSEMVFYNYRHRQFVTRFQLPPRTINSTFFEYKPSFVSP